MPIKEANEDNLTFHKLLIFATIILLAKSCSRLKELASALDNLFVVDGFFSCPLAVKNFSNIILHKNFLKKATSLIAEVETVNVADKSTFPQDFANKISGIRREARIILASSLAKAIFLARSSDMSKANNSSIKQKLPFLARANCETAEFIDKVHNVEYWQNWLITNLHKSLKLTELKSAESLILQDTINENGLIHNVLTIYFNNLADAYNNKPISQIVGFREFYREYFAVNRNVLDPRADSEVLIETVVDYYSGSTAKKINGFNCRGKNFLHKNINKNFAGQGIKITKGLEIATGSGCLAITLAKQLNKRLKIVASDISCKSLNICRFNVALHNMQQRVKLVKSNLFANIHINRSLPMSHCHSKGNGNSKYFDFIVSNPPYIASGDIASLDANVKCHEPRSALDGGCNGLIFYKILARDSKNYLKKGSPIFLEIGSKQKLAVMKIFQQEKWQMICARKDLAGNDRVLVFTLR